MNKLLTLQ